MSVGGGGASSKQTRDDHYQLYLEGVNACLFFEHGHLMQVMHCAAKTVDITTVHMRRQSKLKMACSLQK